MYTVKQLYISNSYVEEMMRQHVLCDNVLQKVKEYFITYGGGYHLFLENLLRCYGNGYDPIVGDDGNIKSYQYANINVMDIYQSLALTVPGLTPGDVYLVDSVTLTSTSEPPTNDVGYRFDASLLSEMFDILLENTSQAEATVLIELIVGAFERLLVEIESNIVMLHSAKIYDQYPMMAVGIKSTNSGLYVAVAA